jgi:peptidoglycan/LPS O-acetylase OafA/YrhL
LPAGGPFAALTTGSDAQLVETPIAQSPSGRTHLPALDGVRGMAALMVMVFHMGRGALPGLGPDAIRSVAQFGWCGVDLFFVLSGFLIGGILLDTRNRSNYLWTFYTRRALRIFPLYFSFLALYIFVIIPLLPGPPSDITARQGWVWTYLANIDVARHGWYSSVGSHANNLWSLAIEEQFYLIVPLAVLLLPRRGVAVLAVVGVVGAAIARVVIEHAGFPGRVGYVLTFTRCDGLSLGVLLAVVAREGDWIERLAPIARVLALVCGGFVTIFAFKRGSFGVEDWLVLQVALPAVTVGCGTLLVLAVSRTGAPLVRRAFESRVLRFFGLYSYGLYMWHPLVTRLLRIAGFSETRLARATGSETIAMLSSIVGLIAGATVVALISYYVLERPFLRLKDRRRLTPQALSAATPA